MSDTKEFFSRIGRQLSEGCDAPAPQNPVSTNATSDVGRVGNAEVSGAFKRWSAANDVFRGSAESYDKLPAGLYRTGVDNAGSPLLIKQKHETDGLIEFSDNEGIDIIHEFEEFWARRKAFQERGFLQKRGFLLWGPPGSGKTSTINIVIKRTIAEPHNGIVLFLDNPVIAAICLRTLRLIEPARPVVAIMEDLDALVHRHGEHEYLALLDGEAQVDRICFVATTNYPERLDPRICNRPSRFDTLRYIGMPSATARDEYLTAKEPSLPAEDRKAWVAQTQGFSLAHLKELIVAVRCLGQPFEVALERLENMRVVRLSSEDSPDRRGAGFLGKSKNGMGLGAYAS